MGVRIRRTVHFSGRVQGVGFRYTTCGIARDFGVGGTVRNLPDGRVEVVAEGAPEELDRFISAIRECMNNYITEVSTDESPGTGRFDRFEITV